MGKLIMIIFLLFAFHSMRSQVPDSLVVQSNQYLYDLYILNQKDQLQTGWFPLGSITVATGGGFAAAVYSTFYNIPYSPGSKYDFKDVLATNTTIPVFYVSGSNNRRAEVFIGAGDISIKTIPFNRYRSVGMKFGF